MKSFFAFAFLFTSLLAQADTFELVKDGKTYTCSENTSNGPVTGSLSQLCRIAQKGNGQTLYHPNGRVFTYSAGTQGATWYYDDGRIITHSNGTTGASWYYSNGKIITHSAGTVGATWYYSNGHVISHSMGTAGATMYYENGSVMTHSAPAMTAEELLYPCDYIR
ncbi:MAG: hypothetical protein ACAH59_06280 [Pseudobdellovibrionaceae bacterium]